MSHLLSIEMINLGFFWRLEGFLCFNSTHLSFPASLPACRLAGLRVKGGCRRADCGNSRSASLAPLLPKQRGSHQSQPTWTPLSPLLFPCNPHTCSPIIRGSNFISTRVAAHCRQPLQSFLINSRFVPYPSFWTHLSDIPIGAGLHTPRQPSDPNPTKNPTPPSFQETFHFFPPNLPITYLRS